MKKIIPFPKDSNQGPKNLPQRDIDLLNDLGIRADYADALAKSQAFGAEIIQYNKRI